MESLCTGTGRACVLPSHALTPLPLMSSCKVISPLPVTKAILRRLQIVLDTTLVTYVNALMESLPILIVSIIATLAYQCFARFSRHTGQRGNSADQPDQVHSTRCSVQTALYEA